MAAIKLITTKYSNFISSFSVRSSSGSFELNCDQHSLKSIAKRTIKNYR